jgi:hypothetical protein
MCVFLFAPSRNLADFVDNYFFTRTCIRNIHLEMLRHAYLGSDVVSPREYTAVSDFCCTIEMPVVKSGRDKWQIMHNGFSYYRDKDQRHWKCVGAPSCKGRGSSSTADTGFAMTRAHNHSANNTQCGVREATAAMRRLSKTTTATIPSIQAQVISARAAPVAEAMPAAACTSSALYRARHSTMTNLPQTLAQLDTSGDYSRTVDGDLFLMHDTLGDGGRLIVYCSVGDFRTVCESDTVIPSSQN